MSDKDVNQVVLVGAIEEQPTLRTTANNNRVCNAKVATITGRDKFPTRHAVVAWGDEAKTLGAMQPGQRVRVEGKLQRRKWTDKEGVEHWQTEVVCAVVQPEAMGEQMAMGESEEDLPF